MGFLFPTYVSKTAFDIDYEKLFDLGYRGLIFDIDYTLVPYNAMADKRTVDLFSELKLKGFKCIFVSNNHEKRVNGFNKDIGIEYVVDACKPLSKGFKKAIDVIGIKKDAVAAIGDQIFTDVLGANNSGLTSIYVRRVAKPGELQLKLKVILERFILFIYRSSKNYKEI